MNLEQTVGEEQEACPDQSEKSADGTKNSLGWCDTRSLFCDIHVLVGRVQHRDGILPPLRS